MILKFKIIDKNYKFYKNDKIQIRIYKILIIFIKHLFNYFKLLQIFMNVINLLNALKMRCMFDLNTKFK